MSVGPSPGMPLPQMVQSGATTSGVLTPFALVIGSGGTSLVSLASLGTTTTVLHGNAAGAPTFGAVSLTADVAGILPLAMGGTNANLSATGGAGQYLKQSLAGATVTVGTIPASDIASGAALSKVNDTNVTMTLGGTPTTALLVAASMTLGWTGTLAPVRGGLGFDASAVAKGGMISGTGAGTFGLTVVGTDGQVWTADAASAGGAKWAAGGSVTPAALTRTNDTNVTVTLGGTPATALLQATSLTLGWTGTLAASRGGLGFDTSTVAKGGMLSGTGAGTWGITTVGADGQVWTADAASAGGIKWATPGSGSVANPTAKVGTVAVNGVAASAIRSDGAPAIDQTMIPTMSGLWTFTGGLVSNGAGANSTRIGPGATAAADDSVVIGLNAAANTDGSSSGVRAIAIGRTAASHNGGSVVIGQGAAEGIAADGNNTIVGAGATCDAGTSKSIAIGSTASITGGVAQAIAIGGGATASAANGFALGHSTSAAFSGVAIGVGSTLTANGQFVSGGAFASVYQVTDVYFGSGVTDASPTDYTIHGTGGSGADIAGANLILAGGRGTGAGVGGYLAFQTSAAGAAGTTLRSLKEWMRITTTGAVNIGVSNTGAILTLESDSINATTTDGIVIQNTSAAAAGSQQWSPRLRFRGQGWKTTATAASQTVEFIEEVQPVQGTTNPTANLVWSNQINAGGYNALMALTSAGALNLATGGVFQINATTVLSNNTLGSGVVTSSLTTVGTIATGVWQATKVGLTYGGTNADLSATGGTSNFLKQLSVGAAVTVGTIGLTDLPAVPQALAFNSTTQSIADSTTTLVTWDSEVFDTDTMHSTTVNTGRLTVNTAGTYMFVVLLRFTPNATGVRSLEIAKNGVSPSIAFSQVAITSAASGTVFQCIAFVQMAATDYVEAYARQTSGIALSLGDASNSTQEGSFYGIRLSA